MTLGKPLGVVLDESANRQDSDPGMAPWSAVSSSEPDEPDYLRDNRANWDDRARLHVASPDYRVADFADPEFLSEAVRFDLPRLGDVAGLRGIHLQCHIGTDTISLSRLGARMTGLDLSPASIEQARRLSTESGAGIDWVVSDVYDAEASLSRAGLPARGYDLVYVSLGALNWLPSVARWAEVVAGLLRPGGRLFSSATSTHCSDHWTMSEPTACWSSTSRTSRSRRPKSSTSRTATCAPAVR